VVVVRERWRAHPLAWLHRAEARAIARELDAELVTFRLPPPKGPLLLRLSDLEMLRVSGELTRLGERIRECGHASFRLGRTASGISSVRYRVA
jgi:hypothetical protein